MIVSGWQGRDSAICICTCNVYMYPLSLKLLSHPGCHMSLSRVPCALHCIHFSSVTQSCLTLCDPMDCSTPGLPVHPQLPELTQTHVHWVGDAIQPSHPLSSRCLKQHLLILQAGVLEWGAIAFSEGIEVPSKCPLLHQPRHTVTLKSVIKMSLGSCPMSSFWTFSFPHKIDQYKPSTWESPKALMYYSWVFHSLRPKESHCPLWSTFFFFFKMNCGFRFCFFNFCACSVAQLCPTLCNSMDCNPPGSSVHGISQARILEGAAISSCRWSSWPRDQTRAYCISCFAGRFFTTRATRQVPFNFYWSIMDLQCCVNFRCITKLISYTYTYIHFYLRFCSHLGH